LISETAEETKMITKLKLLTVCCTTALGAASIAFAQSASDADKHWVRDALEGGNGEVQLGKLAQQKGNSEDVRHFGQHRVDDHTRMGDQLRPIAQKIGVDSNAGTSVGEKATESELKLLSGDAFDKAYIKAMVKDHREDLEAFQKEASTGSDPDVKRAARKGATTVQSHLDMIEHVAKAHNIDVSK
jgi:putative membrane protein